ncbi:MAG: S49 family peptidase, partial [Chloroflexota bacterium]
MNRHTLKTAAVDLWANGKTALHNFRRQLQPPDVDYIVLNLSGSLPEYFPPPPRWQKWLPFDLPGAASGLSFSGLRHIFEQIAGDPRPLGVLLNLDGLDVGWAQAQSLRDAIARLRKGGKKVIAYSGEYGALNYFIAAAADTVIAPPPARWAITGLRLELTFLKDALKAVGVEAEVINVSPYKAAYDTLARADISPEHQAMLDWIMDGQYEAMVAAIADGRQLDPARVRELIDNAPFTAEAARLHGLIDAVLYEDALAETLAPEEKKEKKNKKRWWRPFGKKEEAEPGQPKAQLKRWGAVRSTLRRPVRWRSGKHVDVIALEGTIIPGNSQQFPTPIPVPFLGNDFAGAETIAQHFRDAEKDDDCAAIVFYVDSRGGSALASDLIWREVDRVRRKKPVVALMSNYAASGGYYVSAAAPWIIAQPLTVTGSIGVITMKVVTAGLYDRFNAKRVILQRGAKAG